MIVMVMMTVCCGTSIYEVRLVSVVMKMTIAVDNCETSTRAVVHS